jgi:hypothetical protein
MSEALLAALPVAAAAVYLTQRYVLVRDPVSRALLGGRAVR